MEFKQLLKNTSVLAGTRVVQFLTGLVRTKLIALFLGTLGTGIVSQLTFVTQKMSQFTLLSMSEGVVKQIAENKDSEESVSLINSIFKAYFILLGSFLLLSSISLFIFSESLTIYVFGDSAYLSYFYIGLFSFPILVLDSIPFSILKAFKDVKGIAKARIIIVVINLAFAVPLIWQYKISGAIIYVPISYFVNLSINYFFARKKYFKDLGIGLHSILISEINKGFIKELLLFSTFGLTVGVLSIVSEFTCRSIVVSKLGVDSIGLYSPIVMWASMITGFILPAFSTYLYPRFCELKNENEISGLLNDALRLGTFAIFPLLMIGIPFKDFFISLFYSKEFLGATLYLPYHFLGVVFYVWWYVFSQSMTPTGRIKQHGVFMSLYLCIDIIITYLFVNEVGLWGWMLKHIVSPIIFFCVYFYYAKIYMAFKLKSDNLILMSYLLIASLVLIFIDVFLTGYNYINFVIGPFFILSIYPFLNKAEKYFLKNKLFNKLS